MRDLKSRTGVVLSVDKAIRLFNQGDAKAFEFIYRSYREFVHRICLRMLRDPVEAEDAAQDVFACVFCKINTFEANQRFHRGSTAWQRTSFLCASAGTNTGGFL